MSTEFSQSYLLATLPFYWSNFIEKKIILHLTFLHYIFIKVNGKFFNS